MHLTRVRSRQAAQFLYNFRVLSNDADLNFSALWGKLAAEILNSQWESALEDMNLLLEYIDGKEAFRADCSKTF